MGLLTLPQSKVHLYAWLLNFFSSLTHTLTLFRSFSISFPLILFYLFLSHSVPFTIVLSFSIWFKHYFFFSLSLSSIRLKCEQHFKMYHSLVFVLFLIIFSITPSIAMRLGLFYFPIISFSFDFQFDFESSRFEWIYC